MGEMLSGIEEAKQRYDASRWEISVYAHNDWVTVHISRGLITIELSDLYVKRPNLLERAFKITFETKIRKAIKKQQKRCDKHNAEIECDYEMEQKANKILSEMGILTK